MLHRPIPNKESSTNRDDNAYKEEVLTIATDSLINGTVEGHLLSLCYGEPRPNIDYPGGQQHWLDLSNGKGSYKFTKGHRTLSRQKNAAIAESIFGHLDPDIIKDCVIHITTIGPGGDYQQQDGIIAQAIDTYAEENNIPARIKYSTVAEQNRSYRDATTKAQIEDFELDSPPIETDHNIFSVSLGDVHADQDLPKNRISIVICSGGTPGNVGKKDGQEGYPDEPIIDFMHNQVDHTAEKSILVCLHNDFRNSAVTGYYDDELNDKFLLSSLIEIKEVLGLDDDQLNPNNFYCKRKYDSASESVRHEIYSKVEQVIAIGDRTRKLKKDQLVTVAGLSAQISPTRMDTIMMRGGFSRVSGSFTTVNGNPDAMVRGTVMIATDDLMQACAKGRKYRNGPLPAIAS